MPSTSSVTLWLHQLQDGDPDAAQQLWKRYFQELVTVARKKIRNGPRRARDEDDVALSAFDSFCRGAEQGRFPQLQDRNNLWKLLITITERKAYDLLTYETRKKRDHRRTEGPFPQTDDGATPILATSREVDPAFTVQLAEELEFLLTSLDNAQRRSIAKMKLEGYTNQEIASEQKCALSTVERQLRIIRKTWSAIRPDPEEHRQ